MTGEHKDFWRWLCEELAGEAGQARASGGILPPRPVCLSEVEALGLLLLVYQAQQHAPPGSLAAGVACRLVHTLQDHLQDFGAGRGVNGVR